MNPDPSSTNFGTTLEQRLVPAIERSRVLREQIGGDVRVSVPAIVTAFRPGPPARVDVQVATYERAQIVKRVGGVQQMETKDLKLSPLLDLPFIIPGAGVWSLTFPIQVGDECLVVFADTAIDTWLQNGGSDNVQVSQRRHSLSDGIAIFGLRSTPRGLANYSTNSAQLRSDDGTVVIDLAPGKVTVTAPTVIANCKDLTVTCSNSATITAAIGKLMLGMTGKIRDFLGHSHSVSGASTGPVT